jgi:hypothetical protein
VTEHRSQHADFSGLESKRSGVAFEDHVLGLERHRQLPIAQRAIVWVLHLSQ